MRFLGSCSPTKHVTSSFTNQLLSVELHAVVDKLALDVDRRAAGARFSRYGSTWHDEGNAFTF